MLRGSGGYACRDPRANPDTGDTFPAHHSRSLGVRGRRASQRPRVGGRPITDAITAEGLVKIYKHRQERGPRARRARPDRRRGHRARPARPQRRRQDHHGPHPGHAAAARRRARDRRRLRRRPPGAAAPLGDRPVRPVRGGRREPDRPREPVDVRPALPAPQRRGDGSAPTSCSSSSTSPTPPTGSSRRTPAACAAGSTSPAR